MKVRSRFRLMALLPAVIVVFVVGWTLYWVGNRKLSQTRTVRRTQDASAKITVILELKK